MASISFGNLNTVDGKTTLSGGQSGIDTGTLVETLAKAKRQPAVALETDITLNKSKITQLNTLESKLKTLQDSLGKLRRLGGLNADTNDVFSARLPFLTSSDGTTANNYLGVVAKNGAAIKDYDVTITNLAVAESRKSLAFTSRTASVVNIAGDNTAGRFSAGTFTINGENIVLAEGDNLNNIAAKINARSNTTNVEASILKVNETDFRLIISSTKTGTDSAITITDPTDGVFVGGLAASIFTSVTAAENATLTIDGETITRQSNVISDAIDNVTFSLFQETDELATTPTIKVDISKDSSQVSEAIVGFIDAYNDLRIFYGAQNERDDENEFLDSAVLNDSSLLETVSSSILNSLLTIVGVTNPYAVDDGSAAPKNLTNLGITFADFDGNSANATAATTSILELDGAALTEKIESNFDAVQDLFGFEMNSTSSNLALFERGTVTPSEKYTVAIDETVFGTEARITHIDGKQLATPVTGLTYEIGGTNDGYTELNGTSQYLAFNEINLSTNDFKVEASAYFDSAANFAGGNNILVGGDDANDWLMNITNNNTMSIKASNSGTTYAMTLDEPLEAGRFYDFAVERVGDTLRFYVDGIVQNNGVGAAVAPTDTFEAAVIGGNNSPVAAGFEGRIKDVNIYNNSTLAASYTLDRDFRDRSGNNNHITATGAPSQVRSTTSVMTIKATSGALAGFEYFYTGDGTSTETADATIADGKKDYTIAVNPALDTARITHIRGLALTTAVDLVYTASGSGGTITAQEGSLLGELTLLHFGDSSEAIDISYSQGFADKIYNYLEDILTGGENAIQGSIQDEIDSLKDSNDSLQTTIERIDARVVTYREQLLIKFAALEAAIAASNSTLDLLNAQTNAQNNSNN